ncbi:uncharacterized protein NMK_3099 [Novimethylophilus kurashikiensis]|uniref:Uncharacterized protein n=1 Tax=Novimethylophilus kurashikiensis TaxID=1825523 RepID=A0A2R5FH73_9PROT|nr:uncharacterized protein NMK_3099 [Novimethylophilus kurashikiensis]
MIINKKQRVKSFVASLSVPLRLPIYSNVSAPKSNPFLKLNNKSATATLEQWMCQSNEGDRAHQG